MFFGLFKKEKFGGFIKHYKLQSFWSDLSTEERESAKEFYAKVFYPNPFDVNLIDSGNVKPENDVFSFLFEIGNRAFAKKEYALSEKFLSLALKKEKNNEKKHVVANKLIDVYYKQRSEKEDAIKKCVDYCLFDINLVKKIDNKQDAPSFKRLAIIYENEGKIKEAISISELALQYGIEDGTKSGFSGRIEKLKEKLS